MYPKFWSQTLNFEHSLQRHGLNSIATMTSPNVNPFYIEPKQHEDEVDEWAWEDDTDDLEELLGDDAEGQYPQRRSGEHPVQNLAYAPIGDRIRYMAVALVVMIVFISVLASTSKAADNIPTDGSLSHHDSLANERPRIVVLGERHSGLQWLERSLRICFPNATVSSTLSRVGYFFQDDPMDRDIHVVAVALNPYDWVELMRTHPQYMPNHANIDDWKEFLRKEWTMQRPERDHEMESKQGKVCQMDFGFDEVVSCVESLEDDPTTNPIYELKRDGSGEAFESILELRAAKFQNHVEQMSQWVRSVEVVQYETLMGKATDHSGKPVPGIFDVIEKLASDMDLEWSCSIKYAEPVRISSTHTAEFVTYINRHVNWDAEALFGYTPIDENAISDNVSGSNENEPTGDDDHPGIDGNQKTNPGVDNKQISVGDDDVADAKIKNSEDDHVNDDTAVETSSDTMAPTSQPAESEEQNETSPPKGEPFDFEGITKAPAIAPLASAAPTPNSDFVAPLDAQVSTAPSTLKSIASTLPSSMPTRFPPKKTLPSKGSVEPTNTEKGFNNNETAGTAADDDTTKDQDVDDNESDIENKVVDNGHEDNNESGDDDENDDDTSSSKEDEKNESNDDDDSNDDNDAGDDNPDESVDGEENIEDDDDGDGAITATPSPVSKSTTIPSRGKDRPTPFPTVRLPDKSSPLPTVHLTRKPSPQPTIHLTYKPSPHPTVQVTFEPTWLSTPNPTVSPSAAATYSPTVFPHTSASGDKSSIEVTNSEKGDKAMPDTSDKEGNAENDIGVKSKSDDESAKKGKHKHSSDGDVDIKKNETDVPVDDNGKNDDNGEKKKKHKTKKDKKDENIGDPEENKKKTKHKKHKEKSGDDDPNSKKVVHSHQ